jgi:hypothetical protein
MLSVLNNCEHSGRKVVLDARQQNTSEKARSIDVMKEIEELLLLGYQCSLNSKVPKIYPINHTQCVTLLRIVEHFACTCVIMQHLF